MHFSVQSVLLVAFLAATAHTRPQGGPPTTESGILDPSSIGIPTDSISFPLTIQTSTGPESFTDPLTDSITDSFTDSDSFTDVPSSSDVPTSTTDLNTTSIQTSIPIPTNSITNSLPTQPPTTNSLLPSSTSSSGPTSTNAAGVLRVGTSGSYAAAALGAVGALAAAMF